MNKTEQLQSLRASEQYEEFRNLAGQIANAAGHRKFLVRVRQECHAALLEFDKREEHKKCREVAAFAAHERRYHPNSDQTQRGTLYFPREWLSGQSDHYVKQKRDKESHVEGAVCAVGTLDMSDPVPVEAEYDKELLAEPEALHELACVKALRLGLFHHIFWIRHLRQKAKNRLLTPQFCKTNNAHPFFVGEEIYILGNLQNASQDRLSELLRESNATFQRLALELLPKGHSLKNPIVSVAPIKSGPQVPESGNCSSLVLAASAGAIEMMTGISPSELGKAKSVRRFQAPSGLQNAHGWPIRTLYSLDDLAKYQRQRARTRKNPTKKPR